MAASDYLTPSLREAAIAGRKAAWRECGGGEALPLFLMHGIGSNARAWAGQFPGFGQGRRVVAWNAPGYAGSDPLPADWPVPGDYGDAALALLDHLGIERAIVVGQSLGAIMASAMAIRAPERVAALVLTSPAAGYGAARKAALPETVQRRIADMRGLGALGVADRRASALLTERASQAARDIVHRAMAELRPEGYVQAARLLATSDLEAMARSLGVPTLVVWGAADTITPPASCQRIARAAPGAAAVEIPDLGHALATEAPLVFNQALKPFIDAADERT